MRPSDNRVSRRAFLRRLGLVGGTAVTFQVLVACGSTPPAAEAPTAAPAAAEPTTAAPAAAAEPTAAVAEPTVAPAAAEPTTAPAAEEPTTAPAASGGASGGDLRFGQNNEPDTLDPALTAQASAFTIMMNLYDTLVWMDPVDLQFKPGLAESWESSADGLTYTFKLRQGVTFHDGTPFTAEAVKFTFDRIVDPETKALTALGKLGPYQETKVVDDHTAEIVLKNPYPGFLDSLSQTWLGIVSPEAVKKSGADFGRNPVGTGFMVFKEWVTKDHITLVRNDDYNWGPSFWNHTGPAYLDSITFVPIADNGARLTAFESGDLAIIESVPEQDFDRLKASGDYQLMVSPSQGGPMAFFMNTESGPTSDINVRKAILHGLSQQDLIDTALFGLYEPATGPLSPNTLFYSNKVESLYPNDPAKAMSLLDEAGWVPGADGIREKDGQRLSLDFVNWPAAQPMVIATQGLLQPLGIEVNVKIFDQAIRVEMGHKGEGHLFSTGLLDSEPGGIALLYHSKNIGGFAWSRFKDTELDTLFDQQAIEPDQTKRAALFEQIQLKIMENALIYPAYVFARLHATSADVKNFRVNQLGSYPYFYEIALG